MRCAALARALHRRGWTSRAYLDGDPTASHRWQMASGRTELSGWSNWRADDVARVTFVDHPGEKEQWLSRLRRSDTQVVILDDDRYRDQADLTICPALHHLRTAPATPISASASNENPDSRMLFGPRFAILADIHLATPRRRLRSRSKLLLSMGGADPHRVTPRLAPILDSVLADSDVLHGITTRHVVVGPAFKNAGTLAPALEAAGWRVHFALDGLAMARLMSESRLAVMGFGTSLSELAWHGTPHLSITHHACDDDLARGLESSGIGVHLGSAATLDSPVIASRFRRALEDDAWQQTSTETARNALQGGVGVERILDHLESWIHPAPRSRANKRSMKGDHVAPP
jgi:spore coat polysaccharide biosynthesis predicted glycosyltransferase SpsG